MGPERINGVPVMLYALAKLQAKLDQLLDSGGASGSITALPPGYMAGFMSDAIPDGWIPLDGSESPTIADNPVLFALFGTRHNNPVDELTTRANAVNLIPALTANNAPSPYVASASTEYSGYQAYKAFDSVTAADYSSSCWITASGVLTGWLMIELATATGLTKYTITTRAGAGADPKDWTVEGSNDGGESWQVLDTRTGETGWGDAGTSRTYELDASKLDGVYTAFRLNVTASEGTTYLAISQLTMYGGTPVITQTPDGEFGLPNLKSSPAGFTGGVWCVKAG